MKKWPERLPTRQMHPNKAIAGTSTPCGRGSKVGQMRMELLAREILNRFDV